MAKLDFVELLRKIDIKGAQRSKREIFELKINLSIMHN